VSDLSDFAAFVQSYEEAESLVAAVGQSLVLTVTNAETVKSDYGQGDVPVVEGITPEGNCVRIVGYATALHNELVKVNAHEGATISIAPFEDSKKARPGQKPASRYKVLIHASGQYGKPVEAAKLEALSQPSAEQTTNAATAQAQSPAVEAQQTATEAAAPPTLGAENIPLPGNQRAEAHTEQAAAVQGEFTEPVEIAPPGTEAF
jgi:hypothetical protein